MIGEQFEVIKSIGEGGQGEVFLVKNTSDKQKYALKVIKKNYSEKAINRFKKEINSLKQISSSFVVEIISENISDKKTDDNEIYYVMEFAKYGTLCDNDYYVNDLNLCLELFRKICQGVKAIHDKDLLHRDLKPSNILLVQSQRNIKISDFGLSYELNETDKKITELREKVGAIYFSAPEQTSLPPKPTQKSDIFSLGKILYFMITGKTSKDLEEDLSIKDFTTHKSADKVNNLINKMCAYQPKDRIESVDKIIEIIDDLSGNTIKTEFTFTVLQYRILKFIRSFKYSSVDFDKILKYLLPFYDVDTSGGLMPVLMFNSKISRSRFVEMVETSVETLERNNIIEFKDGSYKYLNNEKNKTLFKKYE